MRGIRPASLRLGPVMFLVIVRTYHEEDAAGSAFKNAAISGAYADRNEAQVQLDAMVKRLNEDPAYAGKAGFEEEQGYWWVRHKDFYSRYTIELLPH